MNIPPPPSSVDSELAEYLTRVFAMIENSQRNTNVKLVTHLDSPPAAGTLARFNTPLAPHITAPGLWFWDGTYWRQVA